MLKLTQALRLAAAPTVAFAGAGGKTTAMFLLARELNPAVVTATTHLARWQAGLADGHFVWEDGGPVPDVESFVGGGVTLVTGTLDAQTERHRGLSLPQMEGLRELADYHDLPLLIEADGARQKALKAPAAHEPAIPEFVDMVVVLAGLSALSSAPSAKNRANFGEAPVGGWEQIHRPEIYAELAGIGVGEPLTPEVIGVLAHWQGAGKACSCALRIALHQLIRRLAGGWRTNSSRLDFHLSSGDRRKSWQPQDCQCSIFAVHEKVAAIILRPRAAASGELSNLDFRASPSSAAAGALLLA
jgi:probable selenium-dependent hydroxylase accessory protein YqeC